MSRAEFEEAVADALDRVPPDWPGRWTTSSSSSRTTRRRVSSRTCRSVRGTPLTERDGWWAAGALPDRITVFRRPTLAIARDREEVVAEVGITVVHEIAHHFGIDDARLHELGWA